MREQKRGLSGLCVALAALLFCVYARQLLFPDPKGLWPSSTMAVFSTPLGDLVDGTVLLSVLLAFALGLMMLHHRARIGWLPFIASLAFLPVQFLTLDASSLDDNWSDQAVFHAPDGVEYHMMERGWLEGTWGIAKLIGSSPLKRHCKVLVIGPMSEFGDGLRVVRPATAPKGDGLFVAPNGMLVVVDSDGLANVAYDPKTDLRYSSYSPSDEKTRPITNLSPFLLLGPSAIPDQSDVAKLRKPKDEGIKATKPDLNNPNPTVRRLAQQLLGDAPSPLTHGKRKPIPNKARPH